MSAAPHRGLAVLVLLAALAGGPVLAQEVSGTLFRDRDGDGVRDAGEEPLPDVSVRLAGQQDAGDAYDATVTSGSDGRFAFTPGDGCYLLQVADPYGWRRTFARTDERQPGATGYVHPVGLRRFGGAPQLLDQLLAGQVRYTSMGDSIAYNWNSCFDTSSFWYSRQVRDRLRCVAPAASVTLDEAAIKGEHTDDLLVDETGELNNVFRVIEAQPELVTISMIGNDLLNDEPGPDPTQEEINRAVAEVLDSRANLQEALAALVSEIPTAEVELNTLYDNLAENCSTSDSSPFHVEWLPIVNRILREAAWGQERRVTNAEVFLEFAHEDLAGQCFGFPGLICNFLGDDIHPVEDGYEVIREKVWESIDGVNLGPRDALDATSITTADHGYLERVARLYPTRWETRGGAEVVDPEAAFDGDDAGAAASVRLGVEAEELRYAGFPDWLDELEPVKVVAGIRYRTSGSVTDDFYRVEASIGGVFRAPPGHAYTATDWNFYTPIVGGGGPDAPAEAPDYPEAELLVVPEIADLRTVTATLTKNPEIAPDGTGYTWPAVTLTELGDTEIRIAAAPVAGTAGDDYRVIVDAVWLDVYGQRRDRPPEVTGLLVEKTTDGGLVLTFDAVDGAEAYNVYLGDLATLAAEGRYTHGSATGSPLCDVPTESAGPGRRQATLAPAEVPPGQRYILVTAMVDGIESPAGFASDGTERPRSESVCR
jgi:lysophospholipase L1-like esterase